MPSPDKAMMRASMADDLAADLGQALDNTERNRASMKAVDTALRQMLAQFRGYKARIEDAHDAEGDGALTDEEYQAALEVHRAMTRMVDKAVAVNARVMGEVGPFAAGLREAHRLAVRAGERERAVAASAVAEDAAEDAYRAERDAAKPASQGNGNTPHPAPAQPPAQAPAGAAAALPLPAPQDAPSAPPAPAACTHCSEPITQATGTATCHRCTSHRNRYGVLPSDRALASRRKRDADA